MTSNDAEIRGDAAVRAAAIRGNAAVRAAARDYERYSSDLQGDQDVRDYKQLPLEVDPPDHNELRALIAPWFVRESLVKHSDEFRAIAKDLISGLAAQAKASGGVVEITRGLALPMIVRCLGVVFGRPQDVDEWFSWGPDTWITDEDGIRHGDHLDRYLKATFDDLDEDPKDDIFGAVNVAEFQGRPLTRKEKYGIANLVLAGGRDTVVKLISGSLRQLALDPELRQKARADFETLPAFINEMVRFLSPLPMMHRVDTEATTDPENPHYAYLSFISANHDTEMFDHPERVDAERSPNPHLGFGFGRHTCIGMHLANIEARIILEEWLLAFDSWQVAGSSEITFDAEYPTVPARFDRLDLAIS